MIQGVPRQGGKEKKIRKRGGVRKSFIEGRRGTGSTRRGKAGLMPHFHRNFFFRTQQRTPPPLQLPAHQLPPAGCTRALRVGGSDRVGAPCEGRVCTQVPFRYAATSSSHQSNPPRRPAHASQSLAPRDSDELEESCQPGYYTAYQPSAFLCGPGCIIILSMPACHPP